MLHKIISYLQADNQTTSILTNTAGVQSPLSMTGPNLVGDKKKGGVGGGGGWEQGQKILPPKWVPAFIFITSPP